MHQAMESRSARAPGAADPGRGSGAARRQDRRSPPARPTEEVVRYANANAIDLVIVQAPPDDEASADLARCGPRRSCAAPCSSCADHLMIEPELLVSAYASGWFPMAVEPGEIRWFSPDPRGIIPLDTFHVPRRLARVVAAAAASRSASIARFRAVIRACAESIATPTTPAPGSTTRSSRATARCTSAGSRTRSKRGRTAAGRRAVRRRAGRRVLRRVDVPPRRPTRRRSRSWRWSSGCARAATRCSTRSGSRRTWSSSARSRSRAGVPAACSSEALAVDRSETFRCSVRRPCPVGVVSGRCRARSA